MDKRTADLALTAFDATEEIKGRNIVGVDLSEVESYTDFVLIVSGGSDRQVMAIADNVIRSLHKKNHLNPLGVEGVDLAEWVLIDFGELVVHVFLDTVREHYHLEDMWMQVKPIAEADFVKTVKSLVVKKAFRPRIAVRHRRKKS